MGRRNTIDRRKLVRGMGVTLALPVLTSLPSRSAAAPPAARPRRLVCIGNHLGFWPGGFFPSEAGKDYKTSLTLKAIEAHRNDFTVFNNLINVQQTDWLFFAHD